MSVLSFNSFCVEESNVFAFGVLPLVYLPMSTSSFSELRYFSDVTGIKSSLYSCCFVLAVFRSFVQNRMLGFMEDLRHPAQSPWGFLI